MDRETFDDPMRRVAVQTSRRAALATLAGGALLLRAPDASEATKKAKRRKDRKRRNKGVDPRLKPSAVWIENTSLFPVQVRYGQFAYPQRCWEGNSFLVDPGQTTRISVGWNNWPFTQMWLRINTNFWFGFDNLPLQLPDVASAFGGQLPQRGDVPTPLPGYIPNQQLNCTNVGLPVLFPKGLNENEYVDINNFFQVFRVRRLKDTNYKEYRLTIPWTFLPSSGETSEAEAAAGE